MLCSPGLCFHKNAFDFRDRLQSFTGCRYDGLHTSRCIKVLRIEAPIKRPLSIKNTCPSQKYSFFCRVSIQYARRPFCVSASCFSINLMRILSQSATRHPSGSRPVKEIINPIGFSLRPLVRLANPRKSSVPCHVQ